MKDLMGGTAIITGASRGIGRYLARTLADQNMNLVLAAKSKPGLEEAAGEIRSRDVRTIVVPTDVGDLAMLEELASTAHREFGRIDVLVNNAGIEEHSAYELLTLGDIDRVVRINLIGAMLLTRLVLPGMLKQSRGHIVNMSSLAGKAGPPFFEPYAASKAGLIAFTESLRAEYRGTGVSASVICPGFVTSGIYLEMKEDAALDGPWILGPSSPEKVTRAVLRAIRKDLPEIIVNPGPTRLLTSLAELSPSFAEWAMRCFGIVNWFRKCAASQKT